MMKKTKWFYFLAGMTLIWHSPVLANENETSQPIELEEIIVSAHKDALVDVIPEERIQMPSQSGSVLDVLSEEAGIQIRRSALAGSDGSALRLRGFDETRLRITRDGVAINREGSYGNGPVDWTIISGESVSKIEIYRGAGPAKFGNTLGGVVNIVTQKPTKSPTTEIRSSMGNLGTWDSSIRHTWKAGPLGWALSAGHFETDGYLRNNFVDRNNLSALFTFDFPALWQVGAGMDYSKRECGMAVYNRPDSPYYNSGEPDADERSYGGPGIGSRLIDGVYAWGDESAVEDKNISFTGFLEKQMAKGRFRMDYRLWNQERTETYIDAKNPQKIIYQRDTDAEDDNWSLQAQASYELGNHAIETGAETKSYGWGAQDVSLIDTSYFNGSINFFKFVEEGFEGQTGIMAYHALYVQDTWAISPALSVELGLRQEWFSADSIDPSAFGFQWETGVTDMNESTLDPRLAITYRPWASGAFSARFGVTHRYPTSPEYFWWYLNNGTGYFNTDFNPEKALQYELAFTQTLADNADLIIRGYYYDVEDYISSTSVPGVGSVYYNIGQVEIQGLEVGLSGRLPGGLRLWANVTLQKGDKADDPWDVENELSRQLRDFPEMMANAGLDATAGKFSGRLWLNYVDDRDHLTSGNLSTLDAYTVVNAHGAYRIWERGQTTADLELTAQNILDENYEENEGYPMAGASVMGGVKIKF